MTNNKILDKIAFILLIAGGLNWGLIGSFDFNLVSAILTGTIEKIVYVLVGISAIYQLYKLFK